MNTVTSASAFTQISANAELKAKPANAEQIKLSVTKPVDVSEVSEQPQAATIAEVDNALNVVNKAAIFEQRSLSFMVDEASGRSIIKVIDRSTDQLIRQIPSEELLKVAQDIKRLQEEMGQSLGFLVDRQV